jgi:lipopolysaccharide transport system permease protein
MFHGCHKDKQGTKFRMKSNQHQLLLDRVNVSASPKASSFSGIRAEQVASPQRDSVSPLTPASAWTTVIQPGHGWRIDGRELLAYRDLFRFLVWRDIKVRYAQSAIGIGWAVLQPLFSMVVFTVVFGRLARISSDGAPYAVFTFAALVPWLYFSNALTDGVSSLISNAGMLRKIYFPRMLMPLSAVAARLLDFAIALCVLLGLMVWYRVPPNWGVIVIPWLVIMMVVTASGVALWLTALAVQFRDVKHAMSFVIQILMYSAPVVYPTSLIPTAYQLLYAMNPMVGVIEGFRSALLGTRDMPWAFMAVGTVSSIVIAVSGLFYFKRKERIFADVA